MENLISYLTEMTTETISLAELSAQLKTLPADLENYLMNVNLDDFPIAEGTLGDKIIIKKDFFTADGYAVASPLKRFKPETIIKVTGIHNNFYLTEDRKLDLFLANHLFGYELKYGCFEDYSYDCGGMYKSGWIYSLDTEVPKFHKDTSLSPTLIEKLNNRHFSISWKEGLWEVVTSHSDTDQVTAQDRNFAKAIVKGIKKYLENPLSKERYVVLRQWDGQSDWESPSSLFDCELKAEEFINQTTAAEQTFKIKNLKLI